MSDVKTMLMDLDYRRSIQKALNEKANVKLDPDGVLGNASSIALTAYQRLNGLPQTAVYDEATRSLLEPFMLSKFLQAKDFVAAATNLGVPVATVRAVQAVESKASGFLENGRCVILFERHKFYEELRKLYSVSTLATMYQKDSDIINAVSGGYVGGVGEWSRFSRAFVISGDAAMKATSWGLFQVMGFNFKDAGFPNVGSMVDAMKESEGKQLASFCQFIKTYMGGKLHAALKAKDWATFARLYNGSAYAKNQYDAKMLTEYIKYSKLYPE